MRDTRWATAPIRTQHHRRELPDWSTAGRRSGARSANRARLTLNQGRSGRWKAAKITEQIRGIATAGAGVSEPEQGWQRRDRGRYRPLA